MLVLSTPTTAPAIPLASSATDATFLAPGRRALMAGWGETVPGGPVPHELHWAGTTVQSSRYCEAHTRVYAPGEELCTLDTPAHRAVACFGDSGGPLLGTLPTTGEVVELGIASHLYTDCEPTSPVVYTRADLVRSWVQDWISSAAYLPGTVTPASTGHTVAGVAPTAEATPGLYSSDLAPGEAVTLHVAGNGEWITEVAATATLSCRRRGDLAGQAELARRSAVHLRRVGERDAPDQPHGSRARRHRQAERQLHRPGNAPGPAHHPRLRRRSPPRPAARRSCPSPPHPERGGARPPPARFG